MYCFALPQETYIKTQKINVQEIQLSPSFAKQLQLTQNLKKVDSAQKMQIHVFHGLNVKEWALSLQMYPKQGSSVIM